MYDKFDKCVCYFILSVITEFPLSFKLLILYILLKYFGTNMINPDLTKINFYLKFYEFLK